MMLLSFKLDGYSSDVTKLINNTDVTYTTFCWLKLVSLCIAQKCLDSTVTSIWKGLLLAIVYIYKSDIVNPGVLCLQKQIILMWFDRNRIFLNRTLASCSVIVWISGSMLFIEPLACYIITSGCAFGTSSSFYKQHRAYM